MSRRSQRVSNSSTGSQRFSSRILQIPARSCPSAYTIAAKMINHKMKRWRQSIGYCYKTTLYLPTKRSHICHKENVSENCFVNVSARMLTYLVIEVSKLAALETTLHCEVPDGVLNMWPINSGAPKASHPKAGRSDCQNRPCKPDTGKCGRSLAPQKKRKQGSEEKCGHRGIDQKRRQCGNADTKIKHRQVTDLDVTDLGVSGPGIPFFATGALWGRVTPFSRSLF